MSKSLDELEATIAHAEEYEEAPGVAWGEHILRFADLRALIAAARERDRLREALDMAAFRLQMLVDRLPPDEDGKSVRALSQTYVDAARTALAGQP